MVKQCRGLEIVNRNKVDKQTVVELVFFCFCSLSQCPCAVSLWLQAKWKLCIGLLPFCSFHLIGLKRSSFATPAILMVLQPSFLKGTFHRAGRLEWSPRHSFDTMPPLAGKKIGCHVHGPSDVSLQYILALLQSCRLATLKISTITA